MEKLSINFSEETKDTYSSQNLTTSPFVSTVSSENFLFVVLDCYSYTAGEKVTGEILLCVSEPLPPGFLKFSSCGKEEILIYDPNDRRKTIIEEKSEVFTIESTLKQWESEISIGQYVFPFTLKIPSYAPSTFYHSSEDQRGHYIKAEILYTITVDLSCSIPSNSLSHTRPILIKNKNSLNKPGNYTETIETIQGCCSNKGSTTFKLSIKNPEHCEVNGSISYKLEPDNRLCKAPINQIISKIVLEFTATTKRGEYKILQNLSNIDRATWISAFSNMIYEKDFEYNGSLIIGEGLNPCSNVTPLIKCVYFAEVLVFYDVFPQKPPVCITLPFHVNPINLIPKEIPKLPSVWNPVESSIWAFNADQASSTFGSEYISSILSPNILSNS